MPIRVVCRSCSSKFQAPDKAAGRHTKCPKCGGVIEVPVKASPDRASVPPPLNGPHSSGTAQAIVIPTKPIAARGRADDERYGSLGSTRLWLLALGGVVVVLVASIVVVLAVRSPNQPLALSAPEQGSVQQSTPEQKSALTEDATVAGGAVQGTSDGAPNKHEIVTNDPVEEKPVPDEDSADDNNTPVEQDLTQDSDRNSTSGDYPNRHSLPSYSVPRLDKRIRTVGLYISDNSSDCIDALCERAKTLYDAHGVGLVVVNPENEGQSEKITAALFVVEGNAPHNHERVTRLLWIDPAKQTLVTGAEVQGWSGSIAEKVKNQLVPPLFIHDTENWISTCRATTEFIGPSFSAPDVICSDDTRHVLFVNTHFPSEEEKAQGMEDYAEFVVFDMITQKVAARAKCVHNEVRGKLYVSSSTLYWTCDRGVEVLDISRPDSIAAPYGILMGKEVTDLTFSAKHTWIATKAGLFVFHTDPAVREPVYQSNDMRIDRVASDNVNSVWLFPQRDEEDEDKRIHVQTATIDQGSVNLSEIWILPDSEGLDEFVLGYGYAIGLPADEGPQNVQIYDIRGHEPRMAGTIVGCPADEAVFLGRTLAIRDEAKLRLYELGFADNCVTAERLTDVPLRWTFPDAYATDKTFGEWHAKFFSGRFANFAALRFAQGRLLAATSASSSIGDDGKISPCFRLQVFAIPLNRE